MSDRASIFDDIPDFDLTGFAPKQDKPGQQTPPEIVRAVSEASSFRSREPVPANREEPLRKELRRYRTGRNVQLNIKVRAETLKSFYELADREGWVLGETLEKAVAALSRELASTESGIPS